MNCLRPDPTRAAVQIVQQDPAVAGMKLHGVPLTTVLARQAQFAIVGVGPLSERKLVPQTQAAADLLSGPHGARLDEILRGSLAHLNSRRGVVLKGITLASSTDGFALNLAMDMLEQPGNAVDEFRERSPDDRTLDMTTELRCATYATRGGSGAYAGWVDLSPAVSRQLIGAAADEHTAKANQTVYAQYVLAHELEHAVTPANGPAETDLQWIEEGTAELDSLQRASTATRATDARLPARPEVVSQNREEWLTSYRGYYHALSSLLHLGGIDPATPAGAAAATKILQDQPLRYVPGNIARQIITAKNLPADSYDALRGLIVDVRGQPSRVDAVREFVSPK